ncbi:hypothetical protein [Serratia ureilytica]|uniref:hypothetical protein n=1 Tax=Serratia ureilytica TaxID=300181 RepID=UPI001D194E5E|nr:hypothetical protein [Serratia ureilytica]MCC4108132.1 hypothetical protein [Serratia ureilytica]
MKRINVLMLVFVAMDSVIARAATLAEPESSAYLPLGKYDLQSVPTNAMFLTAAKKNLQNGPPPHKFIVKDSVTENTTAQGEDTLLPFWGKEARARGYDLPEPFGININYMNIRQNINVDSIQFSNLGWDTYTMPSNLFNIKVDKTRQRSTSRTIRLDAWVLPFMNVYGIVGKTRGSSLSKVSVDSDPSSQSDFMGKMLAGIIHGMNKNGNLQDLDFKLDFKGTTYGAGTVLVGGYDNWFGLLDMNYTQTHFNILDGSINAFTLSPRVGYRFTLPAVNAFDLGESHLNVWVGSMYQNIQQRFKGSLNDLNMPDNLKSLMQIADQEGQGRFNVKQHLQSPWNMLVGANYELTRHFNITTEVGFAERNSFFVSGEYRF